MRRHTWNMHKVFAVMVAVCLGLMMLSACGKKASDQQEEAPAQQEATEQQEETKPEADADDEPEDELGPAAAYGIDGPIWVMASESGTYTMGDSDPVSFTTTYTYDDHGNAVMYEDDGAKQECTYDEQGYPLFYTYTYEDDVSTTTYTYERDADGKVVSRTGDDGGSATWEYYPSGRIQSVTTIYAGTTTSPDGTEETPTTFTSVMYYDETGLLTRSESDFGSNDVQLTGYEYELDENGNPLTCTTNTSSGEVTQTTTRTYTYDENGNVSHVSVSSENMSQEIDITWQKVEEPSVYATLQAHLRTL